jgi:predicted esterase
MVERHIKVTRTARIQLLGRTGPNVREVWFACHGYGQLAADFAKSLSVLESPNRLVVVPEGLSRFYTDPLDRKAADRRVGATWMTREDREAEIADYIAYLDAVNATIMAELPASGVHVHALGFSQGVATVMRWVMLGSSRVDALTLWAGTLAEEIGPETVRARLKGVRVTLVIGERDPMATAVTATEERLQAAGIPYEVLRFPGGHRLDDATLRRLAASR